MTTNTKITISGLIAGCAGATAIWALKGMVKSDNTIVKVAGGIGAFAIGLLIADHVGEYAMTTIDNLDKFGDGLKSKLMEKAGAKSTLDDLDDIPETPFEAVDGVNDADTTEEA